MPANVRYFPGSLPGRVGEHIPKGLVFEAGDLMKKMLAAAVIVLDDGGGLGCLLSGKDDQRIR